MVWKPDGFFVSGAFRDWTVTERFQIQRSSAIPAQRRKILRIDRKQGAAVNRLVEESITGDAFHFQRSQERRPGNSAKVVAQILKHILVSGYARCTFISLQKSQARSTTEMSLEITHVGSARFGLFRQPLQLRFENGGLEFRDAIVETDESVAELVGNAGAAAVHV